MIEPPGRRTNRENVMTYEIKHVADDAVTLTQFGGDLMRIISTEVAPGKFAQVPVMRQGDALRIVRALKLADAMTAVAR